MAEPNITDMEALTARIAAAEILLRRVVMALAREHADPAAAVDGIKAAIFGTLQHAEWASTPANDAVWAEAVRVLEWHFAEIRKQLAPAAPPPPVPPLGSPKRKS